MKVWHLTNRLDPTYPVLVVDDCYEVKEQLTKNGTRLIVGADRGDDRVHVDAKARKVDHRSHCANTSYSRLSFCLVRINKIPPRWSFRGH